MPQKKNMRIKREAPEAKPQTKAERRAEHKEKMSKGAKIVLVAIGCAAMLLSVSAAACSGVLNQAQTKEEYTLTGGVAATVNGVNIKEDTVTKQIMAVRTSLGYDKDEDWAQYLVDNSMTPESYREQVIDSYAESYLKQQAEKEYDITVTDEDLEKSWQEAAEASGGEEAFTEQIETYGFTKDSYKESLRSNLASQKLKEAVAGTEDPTDDEIVAYLNESLDVYNDARRSSNILIKVAEDASEEEDAEAKAKAQEVLDKIESGDMSFADAAKEYSEDTGSAQDGGDVGWDKLTTFVTEYQDALSGLSKGQVSGLVKTTYGYHIIECTDVFKVDGEVEKAKEVPEEIRTYISNILKTQAESTAYSEWWTEYKEKADIVINEMPENVPYNVSLKGVEPTAEGSSN
ncbi:MAG: peptidylprolyl isomerase [Collinsella phocaeensis]